MKIENKIKLATFGLALTASLPFIIIGSWWATLIMFPGVYLIVFWYRKMLYKKFKNNIKK